jgi:hypothetical protein
MALFYAEVRMRASGARRSLTLAGRVVSVGLVMAAWSGCPAVAGRAADAASQPLDAGAEAAAPVGPMLVVPSAGARGVPTNLWRIVVAAGTPQEPIGLEDEQGGPLPAMRLDLAARCDAAWCAVLAPAIPLPPGAVVAVRAGESRLTFETAAGEDRQPPTLLPTPVVPEGRCLAIRVASDEPVVAELRDATGAVRARRDVAALTQELAAAVDGAAVLVALDLAGNSAAVRLDPPQGGPALSPLVLSEALPHPLGAQPAQEWVELHNLGGATASTQDLAITTGGRTGALPAALVPPGGFAVVVGAGFQIDDGLDVPPAPTAALLRLSRPTIAGGLADSAGATVELRDGEGRVISRYGGYLDFSARSAAGSSAVRIDEAGCDGRANWSISHTPSPGAPSAR